MRATRASQGDCLLYIVRDHIYTCRDVTAIDQAIYPQASHPWLPEEALVAMQGLSLFVSLLLLLPPPPPPPFLVDDFPNLGRLLLWHCCLPCLLFIVPQKCVILSNSQLSLKRCHSKSKRPNQSSPCRHRLAGSDQI